MTITNEQAYRKGWDASRRTRTCDLEAAERRFLTRHGEAGHDSFVRGWCDYAADKPYAPHPFGSQPAAPVDEVDDGEGSMDDLGVYVVVAKCAHQLDDLAEVYRNRAHADDRADALRRRVLVTAVRILEA